MSITSEQAEKMVAEKMERENTEPAQPQDSEKPVQTPTTEPEESPKEENKPEPVAEEPKEPESPQEKEQVTDKPSKDQDVEKSEPKQEKQPPRKKYSKDERTAHAFAQEKQKRKELREENERLKARNKEVEAELEKFKGLKLEDFDNNVENYTSWRIKQQAMEDEVKRNNERITESERAEAQLEQDRRVNLSFDTQEEREEYYELVNNNGEKFLEALKEHDPKNVIISTLNEEELYPKILKELMSNMDALAYVFRDKTPRKLRRNFEDFIDDFLDGKKPWVKEEAPQVAQPQPQKPEVKPMPIIGKQVTTSSAPQEPVHDRAYWNNYLRQHPNG